jgi:sigma-B regulation protein RsbU (phosphoserine phosphatase)
LDRELKIAREIQYSLIPDKFPEISGITFAAEYHPATILGGDLYDFFLYDDDVVALAIGDVSGKGAPAALLGALASGMLRTRAGRKYSPAEMLRLVNHSLRQRVIEGRFMTLCYAVYDGKTRRLRFSNSGAPAPILCKQGKAEILHVEGYPLGMFDNSEYREEEVKLEPGDTALFYTDGLSEARDLRGEEFGSLRLKKLLEDNHKLEPRKLIERIFKHLEEFSVDSRKSDDQTILVLKANT